MSRKHLKTVVTNKTNNMATTGSKPQVSKPTISKLLDGLNNFRSDAEKASPSNSIPNACKRVRNYIEEHYFAIEDAYNDLKNKTCSLSASDRRLLKTQLEKLERDVRQ